MFKTLSILLLCVVQLTVGSIELEELKKRCTHDEEFESGVKICSIKDNVAIFEFIDKSMTFRCISITLQDQPSASSKLSITLTPDSKVSYKGAVNLDEKEKKGEINLKLFENYTARIAIVSFQKGFRINDVQLDNKVLSNDWNCKTTINMNTVCGKRKSISRLDKKSDLSWPWVVALYQYKLVGKTARYKAGGSIISTKFVITSGNALFYEGRLLLAEEVRVHVSRTDISPHENQKTLKIYRVTKVILHEQYKFALENNIALLKVENYIEYNDFVAPICFPRYSRNEKEFGSVVGYAKDSWNHHPLKQQATDTSYQLISRNECEKNGFIMNFKYPETFCATANEKPDGSGKVVNIQDSGSGLYIKKDDVWFLGGIMSKASPTDSTVIFTDVFQFTEWIRRKNH